MLQDESNNWIAQPGNPYCNTANQIWIGCITGNTSYPGYPGYRNWIDDEKSNPKTKMNIAKRISRNLITKNPNIRWGVASFRVNNTDGVGEKERQEGGKIVTPIGSKIGITTDSDTSTVLGGINSIKARTATPLGEALLEVTQYYQGSTSKYSVISNRYTSPIQYRCQKNFTIVLTDGDASGDDKHPGVNICTSASTNSTNCPSILEGSNPPSSIPGFGDASNRPRALRDVAKYANELDMRTTGNDLDNKSFDDPKFKTQNMQTYTVGFAIANNVLPAAAKVGGGKYYKADNEAELTSSLTNAVNDIVASVSTAGGVATQTDVVSSANKVFQPVFNPQGWYGELRCFNLDSSGNFNPTTSKCSPNAKAVIPPVAGRKIYSSKVTGATPTTSSFSFNETTGLSEMTTDQSKALGSTAAIQQNTIKFIRGTEGISGFRTRSNGLLGDILNSQPVVVSKPAGQTLDEDYKKFTIDNTNRNMVFIGANDGMLHAFNIANMTELMAYIPSPVYSNLKSLTASDYGINGGTPHEYHVNGSMRQADVKLKTGWKTILVGGLAQGGKGYFAIDATQAENFSDVKNTIKWEWTDQSSDTMGYAFGTPIIYNVRTGKDAVTPAVILTNGYENKWVKGAKTQLNNTSSLYIINADTGVLIKQIDVTDGMGLSSPAGVDAGQDGVLDYVYAGDVSGKLWRFDLTDEQPANFKVISTPIYDAGITKPIVMRPAVMQLNKKDGTPIGNLVMFGTGKLLTDADKADLSQQSFYSIVDKMEDSPTTVVESQLQLQTVTATKEITSGANIRAGNYRKVSSSPLDLRTETNSDSPTKNKGWYMNFPVSGERIVASPMVFDDKVVFGTGIPQVAEKCFSGGKGWIMGLNPFTGSITANNKKLEYSFIDIKKDGKSTYDDKIDFTTGKEFMSGYEKEGIPTELTYVASENKIVMPTGASTSALDIGKVISLREANYMAVYTGNPKFNTNAYGKKIPAIVIYKSMPKPASTGKGQLYVGTIGSTAIDPETFLTRSSGVKVETSTWREIK
jgi:type IV pilus assembly protein PilY1